MNKFQIQTQLLKMLLMSITLAIFIVPTIVSAETVLRVGESVSISADQTVEEDFYALGGTISVSGEVAGDMYGVGGGVTVNGEITEDLSIMGGSVQVHAPVGDDVRIIGGEVTIADTVGGDIFVIAGSLNILSSASVEGDVFFYGGEIEINGPVTGSVMGSAGRFRIDSAVVGTVDISTERLELGERAIISGNVNYESSNEIIRSQNAVIEGTISRNEVDETPVSPRYELSILFFLMNLFAVFFIYLLFKKELEPFAIETIQNYARSSVLGLAGIFVAPVVMVFLMTTILGLLLGLIGLFALLTFYFLSFVLLSIITGAVIAQFFTKKMQVNLIWISVGVVSIHLFFSIPIIGPIIVFVGFAIALGGLIWKVYSFLR